MRITLIVGLPGSGKTVLGNSISKMLNCEFIDDPKKLVLSSERKTDNLVIADPALCIKENQLRAEILLFEFDCNVELNWIFFENDPEQCLVNAKTRPNKLVDDYIRFLSKIYFIPNWSNIKIIPVYKGEK